MNSNITKTIVFFSFFGSALTIVSAQQKVQKIGDNPYTINSSAVFEVESTTKGLLLPRMTTAQRTTIANPASGLQVYDIDTNTVWNFNGSVWANGLSSALPSAKVLVGNTSGIATPVDLTGDVTINDTGVATIGADKVITSKILDANVTTAKIADASVTDTKLAAGSVTSVKILDGNVTTDKLAAGSVTAAKIEGLTSAQFIIGVDGNAANNAKVTMTGDVTMTNTGVTTVAAPAISKITADYTAQSADYTILCNNTAGSFTITLPAAASANRKVYVIRKTDESANALSISPPLKLNESDTVSSLNYNTSIRVQSDGTSWNIIE